MQMRKQMLTKREKDLYDLLLDEGGTTLEELAKSMGVSTSHIQGKLGHLKAKGITIHRHKSGSNEPYIFWVDEQDEFEDKPIYKEKYSSQGEYGGELLKGVKKVAEVQTNRFLTDIRQFDFAGNQSIGIVFLADFHLGHQHADYGAAEWVFDMIANTPNLYVVLVGDMIDNSVNAIAPRGTTNIVDKDGQLAMLEHLIDKIKDRILVMYEGNHEIRSVITDHFRITHYIAGKAGSEYGQYGDRFVLLINDVPIMIYCRHKMKGHSQYNPLHPNTRAVLFDSSYKANDCDILVRAHSHESAIGEFRVGAKVRHMAVCGNIVVYDEFADRVGYESMKWSMPVFIIRPDASIRMCRRFKEGVEDLRDFNEVEKKREVIDDEEE